MRIRLNRDACMGHAMCAAKAPEIYGLDEEGYCSSDGVIVPPGLEGKARRGAAYCPESAITLIEEDAN